MHWNGWSIYWSIWLFLLFGVPEIYALATGHPENTLSFQVWHLEGTGATFWRFFICAFLVWLLLHMVFRIFR